MFFFFKKLSFVMHAQYFSKMCLIYLFFSFSSLFLSTDHVKKKKKN